MKAIAIMIKTSTEPAVNIKLCMFVTLRQVPFASATAVSKTADSKDKSLFLCQQGFEAAEHRFFCFGIISWLLRDFSRAALN